MENNEDRLLKLEEENRALRTDIDKLKEGNFETIKLSNGLQIFDKESRIRIALMLLNEEPAFAFFNSAGKVVISFTLDESAPDISLNGSNGDVRAKFKVDAEGEPMIIMNDSSSSPRLSLSVVDDSPRLMFHDNDYKMRLAISLESGPYIQMYDNRENVRVNMSIIDGVPEVCLVDDVGRKVGEL
jgi:hypothetical protein